MEPIAGRPFFSEKMLLAVPYVFPPCALSTCDLRLFRIPCARNGGIPIFSYGFEK